MRQGFTRRTPRNQSHGVGHRGRSAVRLHDVPIWLEPVCEQNWNRVECRRPPWLETHRVQRGRWPAEGQKDIVVPEEPPLLGAEDHRMDVAAWLQGLGLERYVPAFRDNEIDWEVLPKLTSEDLREIGITAIGHRRKLLDAIAALGAAVPAAAVTAPACTGTSRCRTPSADGGVLRSCRLDGTVGAVRSGGSARADRRLSPRGRRDRRRVRRLRRQIHGRWGADLFRLPTGP